jgi:hypothetical protein
MKILRLTNSTDLHPAVPEEKRAFKLSERMLADASGEEVETILKTIWPSPGLPDAVSSWMERYRPEMAVVVVGGLWYTYDSTLWKLRRKYRRFGAGAAPAVRITFNKSIAHTRPYRMARRMLMRTVGAEPFFTPDEVVECMEATVRRILAHEPLGVVVRVGPALPFDATPGNQRECERRWHEVNERLKEFCERVHVAHIAREQPVTWQGVKQWYLPDHLHFGEEEHARRGEEEGRALVAAWERSMGRVG